MKHTNTLFACNYLEEEDEDEENYNVSVAIIENEIIE